METYNWNPYHDGFKAVETRETESNTMNLGFDQEGYLAMCRSLGID